MDGRNIDLGGKLWLSNQKIYNDTLIKQYWQSYNNSKEISVSNPGLPICGFIYPIFSIPLLFPYFTINSWAYNQYWIWALSSLLLIGFILVLSKIFKNYGLKISNLSFLLSAIFVVLAFKSSIVAVYLGQPALFSLFFLALTFYYWQSNKMLISALFLALASVKISLTWPIFLIWILSKQWKALMLSIGILIISSLIFFSINNKVNISNLQELIHNQMYAILYTDRGFQIKMSLTSISSLLSIIPTLHFSEIIKLEFIALIMSTLLVSILYIFKKISDPMALFGLLLTGFCFQYHLVYDVLIFVFLIPILSLQVNWYKQINVAILFLLAFPLQAFFPHVFIAQYHLPILFLVLLILYYGYIFTIFKLKT